jgi:tetratricopeptide (TPR) repeat protein
MIIFFRGLLLTYFICAHLFAGSVYSASDASSLSGDAPLFTLKSTSDQLHDLSHLRNDALAALYFSNAKGHGRPEFLITSSDLFHQFPKVSFNIWGICNNAETTVAALVERHALALPVLVDDGRVSSLYNAGLVLPALVLIGPDLKIHDVLQGPEASLPDQLIIMARRFHQRGFIQASQWLCERVLGRYSDSFDAQHLLATIMRQSAKFEQSEQLFYELSRLPELEGVMGKEGLAQLYAARGEYDRALNLTAQIAKLAKKRAVADRLQGDIDLAQGEMSEAQKKYKKALKKKEVSRLERARITNQLGRIEMVSEKGTKAAGYFKDSIAIEPLYDTARYNLGLFHQAEGEWELALELFERLKVLEPESVFAASLVDHVTDVLTLQKDAEAHAKMAKAVGELSVRLSKGPWEWVAAEDDWTTEPLKLALIEPLELAGLSERAGYPVVTNRILHQRLMESGRVELVDPLMLAQTLDGSEVVADALLTTLFATKLGRVLGARIVGLGSYRHGAGPSELVYRLIDARLGKELTRIEMLIPSHPYLATKIALLADNILEAAVKSTPLQAFVVEVKGDRVLLNLGSGQGVTTGRFFDVIEAQSFIEYKGKTLYPEPIRFARLQVVQVEADFSYARIIDQKHPIKRDDKVIEDISDLVVTDLSH